MQLQLLWLRFVLAHPVLEPILAIAEVCRNQQDVGLRRGDHPGRIVAHVDSLYRVTEPGEESLRILAYLLVQANLPIKGTDSEATLEGRGHLVEHRICLVEFLLSLLDLAVQPRVKRKNGPVSNAHEQRICIHLTVPLGSREVINFLVGLVIGRLELLDNLARLQVKIKELGSVIRIGEDQPVLIVVQHHVGGSDRLPLLVFDIVDCE